MKDKKPSTHVYLGRAPCGCAVSIVVDDVDDPKWTAGVVAEYIKEGRTIERMTMEQGKELFLKKCPHIKPPKQQASLFA